MKIKDASMAISVFEKAASNQAKATEQGKPKEANKSYNKIVEARIFLKNENSLDKLLIFLNHLDIGVRLWAASSLLSIYSKQAIEALEEIIKIKGIHSFTAKMILEVWYKGDLKIY